LAKAEAADTGMTMAGAVLGTLDFMPPEQRRDVVLTDARSDLWSLAATLYQLVTGKSPRIIRFDLLPPSLTSVLGKALEENKEDRFQTAAEMRAALQTALQPADTGEVELITGQCPSCGTNNEAGRKFCRKCAASLEVPCLSCKKGIQLWDEVCGQCGTKQGPLLEQRKSEMHEQQQKAETLRQDFQFEHAVQIATSLRDVADPRLQLLKGWADRFLTDIQEDIKEQRQRSQNIMSEALAHEAAYDDNAGIRAIEKIPDPLRGEILTIAGGSMSPHQLMTRLNQRMTKATQLEQTIQKRLKERDLNGLLPEIEELLKYRPNREDVVQIKKQLEDRSRKLVETRDKVLAEAAELLNAQRYPEALAAIQAIDPSVATPQVIELRKSAEQKNNQVLKLRKEIQHGVNSKQYDSLLEPIEELLSLVGTDEAIQRLRDQLLTREKDLRAQVKHVIQSNSFPEKCQFRQASEPLAKIPATKLTEDAQSLIDDCESLAFQRDGTLSALKHAITEEKYAEGVQASLEYHNALSFSGTQDPEFQGLSKRCRQSLAEQRADDEAAERQQAVVRKTAHVVSAVVAGVIVLGIGLWIYSSVRSSMGAKAIAEGIAAQPWEAVLDLDSKNAQALLGRAGVRINQAHPDFEGAFKDLETAESINIQTAGLKELKAAAYAKRSQWDAELGRISEAESNLQNAERLNAAEAIIAETKKAIEQAYLKQADTSPALKATLVTALRARFRKSLTSQDYERAGEDYKMISRLDASLVDEMKDAWPPLPEDVLAQLPHEVLAKLPNQAFAKFPPLINSLGMALKWIPSGKFRIVEGKESHNVMITRPYYLGVFEVTQEQYQRVMGENPSRFKNAKNPVEEVSWVDAVSFCKKLSEVAAEKSAGRFYRLPTEAEWEYACRAGTSTAYCFGDARYQLHNYAWYGENSESTTHSVGLKKPNAFGLYDMHGNVWEWCQDWYSDYPSGALIDPRGPSGGTYRVSRGGSWGYDEANCRSAFRSTYVPTSRSNDLGFRVALSPYVKSPEVEKGEKPQGAGTE
jgi:formylglycine-generating enzyme required for sulfatase activity